MFFKEKKSMRRQVKRKQHSDSSITVVYLVVGAKPFSLLDRPSSKSINFAFYHYAFNGNKDSDLHKSYFSCENVSKHKPKVSRSYISTNVMRERNAGLHALPKSFEKKKKSMQIFSFPSPVQFDLDTELKTF